LLLGAGGGTSVEIYRRLYPNARVTGVEIDREMVRAGQEQLGIDLSGVEIVIEDARTFASRAPRAAYDVIILDAFQFPYVPFQLTTHEFFRQLDACLAPGGVVVVNAGRQGEHRAMVHALARTLASVFPHLQAADAPNRSNTMLVASHHRPTTRAVPPELRSVAAALAPLAPARWPADTPLLTDDHAPVEWLTDRIIWAAL
jgi:spermidine synthase